MEENNVINIVWPWISPDRNIFENVWRYLARHEYKNGKHYDNKVDLAEAINQAWSELDANYIQALYNSIPSKQIQVIELKGSTSKY